MRDERRTRSRTGAFVGGVQADLLFVIFVRIYMIGGYSGASKVGPWLLKNVACEPIYSYLCEGFCQIGYYVPVNAPKCQKATSVAGYWSLLRLELNSAHRERTRVRMAEASPRASSALSCRAAA